MIRHKVRGVLTEGSHGVRIVISKFALVCPHCGLPTLQIPIAIGCGILAYIFYKWVLPLIERLLDLILK